MAGVAAVAPGVAVDGGAQQGVLVRGFIAHLLRRLAGLTPRSDPGVLVDAAQERPGFRIVGVGLQHVSIVFARPVQRMAGAAGAGQPLQADALLAQPPEVVRLDFQSAFELFQREVETLRLAQGLARPDPGVGAKRGDRSFVREHQHIADVSRLARQHDAIFPGIVLFPEFAHVADAQGFPVRLLQVRQQLVHRAHLAAVPGFHRRLDHCGKVA